MWGVPGRKGELPLQYRLHAIRVAQRRIKELLAEGWTQEQIGAAWGGLSQATISDLKNGTSKMGLRILLAIREGLQIPLDEILGLPPLHHRGESRRPPAE